MFYSIIKSIHISCVMLSISGFILRGIWLMRGSSLLFHRLTKRLPHVIDTLLLASGLLMVYLSAQYPIENDWLTAKLLALVVYILLGMLTLRWGKTQQVRIVAWLFAVMVFIYIVLVALARNPLPFIN